MSVGYGQAKLDFDNKLGSVCIALRNAALDVQQFAALVASKQGSYFTGLGYTSDEATEIQTNIAVVGEFANAIFGTQAIATPTNCVPFMAPFTGVN